MSLGQLNNQDLNRYHQSKEQIFNESQIIDEARKDPGRFGILYEKYYRQIFVFVFRRTGDEDIAGDIVSDAFLKAMVALPKYEAKGLPFSAWLYRIAHNLVANWHRDRSRKHEIPISDAPLVAKGDAPEASLVHTEQQESLLRLIRSLPSERQTLLILKFVEHYSNAEIGAIMGRSEGAVKSLYHRTLLSLRDEIGDYSEYSD